MKEEDIPAVGTRVSVTGADGKKLGFGIYVGEVEKHVVLFQAGHLMGLVTADTEKSLDQKIKQIPGTFAVLRRGTHMVPGILLDSGQTIAGSECWWEPAGGKPCPKES